jgi:Catalase
VGECVGVRFGSKSVARGTGAHGYFECTDNLTGITSADLFGGTRIRLRRRPPPLAERNLSGASQEVVDDL